MFQSLTGSIHTRISIWQRKQKKVFQSLTGSIHTKNWHFIDLLYFYFNPSQVQFTHFRGLRYRPVVNISIPHRFNSHIVYSLIVKLIQIISIPHRFNSHKKKIFLTNFLGFNFNPSQVQFTRYARDMGIKRSDMFQSLTGSIHTKKVLK